MNITEIVILAVALLAGVFDIYLYMDKKPGNTISQVIIARSHEYPAIPFALGFLMGHLVG